MFTSQVYDFVFPLPPYEKQAAVVAVVMNYNRTRELISSAIEQAANDAAIIDQSILANAFRGELVPQDPADEPASALLERLRTTQAEAPPNGIARGKSRR